MTHLQQLVGMAVDAQRELVTTNNIARAPLPADRRRGLAQYAEVQRARLAVCAEHFAALAPANDGAFTPSPEPELA